MKREPLFKTEADLCDAFMEWAKKAGWTPYPETCGWDILLVSPEGFQCGVEAKLRLNLKVISQAMPDVWQTYDRRGPDHRAVLVPEADHAVCELLSFCGVEVFTVGSMHRRGGADFIRYLTRARYLTREDMLGDMFDWNPAERHKLPGVVPDVRAGVPGPVKLTAWKLGALRIMAMLEVHGSVTREDFRKVGIDPRRWCAGDGWLVPVAGRRGHWARGRVPDFDQQHPDVYAKFLAEEAANDNARQQAKP